ncbi:hypothetical protein A0257_06110 [Hymenobacter psoromatis]|nr:hypothetical protein A0257_06110 [Hymenobacter psoromatis]
MRNLLKPNWLLLVTVLPLGLLALLCWGEFGVIKTLLPPASVALWGQLALGLAGLLLGTLSYAGWAGRRGRPVSAWYAGAALLAYGAFLLLCTGNDRTLVPFEIPRWLLPTDILLAIWTFVMPTLAYSVLVLVMRATPARPPHSLALTWGLAAAVPLGGLLMGGILGSLGSWRWLNNAVTETVLLILAVAGTLLFLFLLVRGAYIMTLRRATDELSIIWKVVITLLLPLLGLAVNAGLWLNQFGETNIFGDFNRPWFYGLAALNGVLLCWPTPAAPRGRLALLLGRSVLLSYTGYFFVVFLPFLPLSLLAVVAIGVGFLMLTPLVLLVVHLHALADDVAALRAHYPRWVPRAALLGGAAVLPLLLTADYYHDRRVLHAALAYAYSPDFTRKYDLDAAALARTLAVVRQHKDNSRQFYTNSQQPYLSTYYNWLVLDNLTLSADKINALERIFVSSPAGPEGVGGAGFGNPPATATLRQLTARSTYDARQQAWVSWVDLAVANPSATQPAAEYTTTFALPPGCWVGGYYLDLNGRREPGILAEKKAADWVYAQITHQTDRRDPGLLTYVGPDRLRLRVYPVALAAERRTGFQVLHKEPVTLTIDGRSLALGTAAQVPPPAGPVATPGGGVVYLSAAAQQRLPLVRRQPYYHFLLDVSAGKAGRKVAYKARVATFLRQHAALGPPRFTLVNTYATPVPAGADWQAALDAFPNAGGCYLTGAVQRVLAEAWQHPAPTYPVLVAVTDTLAATVLAPDFAAFAPAYPEGDTWLVLGADGRAERHALGQAAAQSLPPAALPTLAVRAWPSAAHARAYLPATGQPAVVLREPAAALPAPAGSSSRWLAGLLLRGYDQWQTLHPAAADDQRLAWVQASFTYRILTPLTSFLALENASQKAALRRKQAQTLAANANLDAQEAPNEVTAVPLDDYAPWLLLLGVGLGWRRLRRAPRLAT